MHLKSARIESARATVWILVGFDGRLGQRGHGQRGHAPRGRVTCSRPRRAGKFPAKCSIRPLSSHRRAISGTDEKGYQENLSMAVLLIRGFAAQI
ncbi:hypothetical protein FKM82_005558 [Ascaphus truei]